MHLKGIRDGIADDATTGHRAAGTTVLFEIQLVAGVKARINIRLEKINYTTQRKTVLIRESSMPMSKPSQQYTQSWE